MTFDGYDLNMVGVVLAAGSALLLAKAYLFPSFPEESAATIFKANPFQIRNGIIQRREATAGAIWLMGSLLAFLTGYAWTAYGGEIGFLLGPFGDALLVLAVGIAAWCGTIGTTNCRSRRAYLPRMIQMLREGFEQDSFVIAHGGLYQNEIEARDAVSPSPAVREKRLESATRHLDQIGKLIDIPRRKWETDSEYVERLRPFFESIGGSQPRS
ncbi:MAG: hypothetical protein ACE5JQ_16225 [Candidatus Methylomirabilales bacterium]